MTQYARRFQKGAVAPDKAQQISAAQKTTELSPSKSFTFQIFQSPSYGRSALMGNHGKPTFAVKLRLRILGTLGKGLLCPKAEPEVCAGEGALDSPRIPDSICKYCKWNLTAKWNGSKWLISQLILSIFGHVICSRRDFINMLGVRLTQIPWFPGDTLQYPIISYHHRIGFCWGPRHRQRVPQPRLLCEWAWHWHWHWHGTPWWFALPIALPSHSVK